MNVLIPAWIIGGPFIGLLILSVSLKASSSMGGSYPRLPPRGRDNAVDPSAPLVDPIHPNAPRRLV
jgi:hypothetical protein